MPGEQMSPAKLLGVGRNATAEKPAQSRPDVTWGGRK